MSLRPGDPGRCPLCGRPFGRYTDQHHLVPRLSGGKEVVPLHSVCHNKVHSVFSARQLAREYNTIERLRAHPEIIKFVKWVSKKSPDYHDPSKETRRLKKGKKA